MAVVKEGVVVVVEAAWAVGLMPKTYVLRDGRSSGSPGLSPHSMALLLWYYLRNVAAVATWFWASATLAAANRAMSA